MLISGTRGRLFDGGGYLKKLPIGGALIRARALFQGNTVFNNNDESLQGGFSEFFLFITSFISNLSFDNI